MKPRRAGLGLLAFAAACFGFRIDTRVSLHNGTGAALSGLTLEVAGETVWTGDLAADAALVVPYEPARDGSFVLRGTLPDGTAIDDTPQGYTTRADGQPHSLTVG